MKQKFCCNLLQFVQQTFLEYFKHFSQYTIVEYIIFHCIFLNVYKIDNVLIAIEIQYSSIITISLARHDWKIWFTVCLKQKIIHKFSFFWCWKVSSFHLYIYSNFNAYNIASEMINIYNYNNHIDNVHLGSNYRSNFAADPECWWADSSKRNFCLIYLYFIFWANTKFTFAAHWASTKIVLSLATDWIARFLTRRGWVSLVML